MIHNRTRRLVLDGYWKEKIFVPIEFIRCCELLTRMIEKYGDQIIPKIIIEEYEKDFSKICPENGIQRIFAYIDAMDQWTSQAA